MRFDQAMLLSNIHIRVGHLMFRRFEYPRAAGITAL